MGFHLEDSQGEAKRRHTRYAKKELIAKIQFLENPLIPKEQVVESKVIDVSAGGMCVLISSRFRVKKQDELKFVVLKNGGKDQVIRGEGKIVRLMDLGDEREVGVKFTGAVQS